MARQVFFLDLRSEDMAADYETCHLPGGVPAEVIEDIRSAGTESMQIFRLGTRLVMITESSNASDVSDRVTSQASRDWEARMDRFQLPLPGGPSAEKWRPAQCIFDLSEHYQKGNKE